MPGSPRWLFAYEQNALRLLTYQGTFKNLLSSFFVGLLVRCRHWRCGVFEVCSTIRQSESVVRCICSRHASRNSGVGFPKRRDVVQPVCTWCLSVGVLCTIVGFSKNS